MNKITCKLWRDSIGIPNTPYTFLFKNDEDNYNKALTSLDRWDGVFVKPSNQGSSIECTPVEESGKIIEAIDGAFFVLKSSVGEKIGGHEGIPGEYLPNGRQ